MQMVFKYSHMDWIAGIEEPHLSGQEKIYLWGAGKIGGIVAHALSKRGLDFIAYVDSARDKQGEQYFGHDIISPEEFYTKPKDTVVICSCAFPNAMDNLKNRGYVNVYNPVFLLKEIDFDGYQGTLTEEFAKRNVENALHNYEFYYNTGLLLERLVFIITDKCSLKCINCDGYVAYHNDPRSDSAEDIQYSYERIMAVCKRINAVDIMGGEPLVHPDIAKIVRGFVEDERCGKVTVISNGTIIPSRELLEVLMNPKCVFRISDYGKISTKKDELIKLLKTRNIRYEVTNYQYWDRIPLIQLTNESEEKLDKKFATCTTNVCYVKHGQMFCCTFAAGLSSLLSEEIPNFNQNYIELINDTKKNVEENTKKFIQRIRNRKHIDACKYCPGSHCLQFESKQPVAEQAHGVLPLDGLFKDGRRIWLSQTKR